MKVLQINSVCGIRSTGRIVSDIAEDFIANGHECKIAYGREKAPEKYESVSYKIGNDTNVFANVFKARILDNEGFNAKRDTLKFLKWAEKYNPDVLWLHNLHGYYINVEMLFDWIKSRPEMEVRWTLHDCWAFTGHCAYFSYVKCFKWKDVCEKCTQTRKYPSSMFRDASYSNFQRKKNAFCGVRNMKLICPSQWLAELVRKSFLKDYPVEVKHNNIDNEIFCPTSSDFREKMGLVNKKIVLGVASVWDERKGLSDFIKLSEILNEDFCIVLVGISPSLSKKLPLSIIALPRTNSKKELAEIYSASDVFVNLTYEDNYPTVNLEAQACGTPCFTYETGGSIESVPAEHVVRQGDIAAMAMLIETYVKG